MNRPTKNQKGFAAVEAALVVVIVVAIAGVGWYVYTSLHGINGTYSSATQTSNSASPKFAKSSKTSAATQAKSASAGPVVGYLTIKELGIKLPLTDGIKDLNYYDNPSKHVLYFSTGVIDKINSACAPSATNPGAFGETDFEKTALPANEVGSSDGEAGDLYAHANGYYLYWKESQSGGCTISDGMSSADQDALTNDLNTGETLLQAALKGAVAD